MSKRYWAGFVSPKDNFGDTITDEFIDAPTKRGPWALMTPASWKLHRRFSVLGTGYGQKYRKQVDGRWLKVAG